MKLSVFLMLIGMMQVSANVYSQAGKISVQVNQVTLSELLWELQENSGIVFVYKTKDLMDFPKVSIDKKDASVTEILDDLLLDTDLEYSLDHDVVIIKKKLPKPIEVKSVVSEEQEKKELKGTVTDADGNTLPGVSVVIKGTTLGVATNIDGDFSIQFDNENVVLVFSFVGMISQEIVYSGQSIENITLLFDSEQMDEVVVTGYQTLSRERATGAFEKVNAVVLEEKSSMNIMDKLEGQTTGVLFDKDGNIEIRGRSTLFANEKPLIVVDGFPIEGDMETINPNDIESITVLKDASAASIWGARAANGVIVIVSKKGAGKGKTNVEFTSSLSLTQKPDLYDLPFASTGSFLEAEEFLANNKYTNLPAGANQYPLTDGMDVFLKLRDGIYTQEQTDAVVNGLKNTDVRDEFSDLFLRKAVRQQYSLAISGNSEKNSYYASVNYDDNQSFSKQSDNDRIISNINLNSKLNDRLSVNIGINAIIRNQNNNGIGFSSITGISQYQKILDENGNYINQSKSYYQEFKDNLVDQGYPYDWNYNLKREFDNKDNSVKNVDLKLKAAFNYKIIEGLDFEGRYQYEWGDTKGRNLYNEETYYARNFVNYRTVIEDGEIVSYVPKGSILGESYGNYKAFTTRGQLNFNKSFKDNLHNITAISGIEVRKVESESSNMKKYGYDPQSLQYTNLNLNERFPTAVSGRKYTIGDNTRFTENEDRFISYYGNIAYTYAEKYTLTASARLDDSNLFGADSDYRNVPLWSIGGNWQIHKEEFFDFGFINQLSLRATYGLNGNVDKTTSPHMIALVSKDNQTQNQFAYVNNPSNPKLRWERTSVTNLGLDFSMFHNRLSGSIEYYNKYSDGLLGFVSLNSTYGFSQAKMNVAEISNKGLDFSLNALAIDKAFKWNVGLNFSHNKNVVKEIEMPDETPSSYLSMKPKVGLPYAYMYSYKWAGLSSEGLPQVYDQNGDIISSSDAIEDADALKYEGTTTPKFYGSVINNFAYKGISLRLLMTYKLGHVFRRNTLNYRNFTTSSSNRNWIHEDYEKRWQKPGDELTTDVPVFPGNSSMLSSYFDAYTSKSSNTVLDASHIRIKEVILSYDMPAKIIKPLSLSKLKFSVQARNLGVIVFNSKNIDPENIPNISGGGILNQPEFTFSLKGTF